MNCFNLIERVVIKKTRNFELIQDIEEIKEIENVEKEIKQAISSASKKEEGSTKEENEKEVTLEQIEAIIKNSEAKMNISDNNENENEKKIGEGNKFHFNKKIL